MQQKIGKYDLGEQLGQGSFSIVKKGLDPKTKEEFAIKIINKQNLDQFTIDGLLQEVNILKLLDNENIIKLHEILASTTKLYLILEFIKGGDLSEVLYQNKKLSQNQAKKYFKQMLQALQYCKLQNVAHRDLKPQNILLQNDTIKLSDFGLSCVMKEDQVCNNICGTLSYMAPEVISNREYCPFKADIWSLGIILHECLTGIRPFEDTDLNVQMKQTISGKIDYSVLDGTPQLIQGKIFQQDLITQLLHTNPQKRLSLEQIWNHSWIQNDITQKENQIFESMIIKDNSPRKKVTKEALLKPQKINAFELISFLQANALNKLIQNDQQQISKIDLQNQMKNTNYKNQQISQQLFQNLNFCLDGKLIDIQKMVIYFKQSYQKQYWRVNQLNLNLQIIVKFILGMKMARNRNSILYVKYLN